MLSNPDYPVREQTRQRVLDAVNRLNFRPNDLARGLLTKRTSTVGLVVPDMANPFYADLARGVEAVASHNRYTVILCNTDRSTQLAERHINVLAQKQVDGIIIGGGVADFRQPDTDLGTLDTRIAVIGRHDFAFPTVVVDNVAGGRMATSHLIDLGHRVIAFIGGPDKSISSYDRHEGFRGACLDAGIEVRDDLVLQCDFSERSGYEAAHKALAQPGRPTAIFAANDRMAVGAIAAATDAGLSVPRELSVVGFDDITLASYVRPALTTVLLPAFEMGRRATQIVLDQIAGADVPSQTRLQLRLVVRETTAPPA